MARDLQKSTGICIDFESLLSAAEGLPQSELQQRACQRWGGVEKQRSHRCKVH